MTFEENDHRTWTKERIHAAFRELYARYERDEVYGAPVGKPWNQAYVTIAGGRNLLRTIAHAYLTPEAFLRQIGGEIFSRWTRGWHAWDSAREQETLREAHARWRSDSAIGKSAGKRFNIYWLENNGYRSRVACVDNNYPGGMQALVRTLPMVSADWSFRARVSTEEIRRRVRRRFDAWQHDPRGRLAGTPFGWTYLRRIGEYGLPTLIQRRGYTKVFRGRTMARVRRAWSQRIHKR